MNISKTQLTMLLQFWRTIVVAKPVCKSVQDILPVSVVGNFELYNGRILGKDILFAFIEDGNVIATCSD